MPTSKFAIASLVCLLGNLLIFTSLRLREVIITSGLIMIVATLGFVLGTVALKRLHRRKGRLQGEGAAIIGKYANLGLALLMGTLFVYSLAMAVLRGQLLN
ncbi:MAG: hypothetical protein JJT96_17490 [Opitutales bacterium]|nr:hypothetical protein [Opitutales bacterium]